MMQLTFTAENFRVLRHAKLSPPAGMSVLVGPNGSGKSTLLDLVKLMQDAATKGVASALDAHGGPSNVLTLSVLISSAPDSFAQVVVQDTDVEWTVQLRPRGIGVTVTEVVRVGLQTVAQWVDVGPARVPPVHVRPRPVPGMRTMKRGLAPTDAVQVVPLPWIQAIQLPEVGALLEPVQRVLATFQHYRHYALGPLRRAGSQISSDTAVSADGTNVFSVLRNWRDKRADEQKYKFVIDGLRLAFPETFEALEFEHAGQTVGARLFAPGSSSSIGHYFAPDGLMVALLHLAAVASAAEGALISIDEFETSLHPYAIRALLEVIGEWCASRSISVLIATHSPVVLDRFKETPDRVLVMDPREETTPIPLDKLRDPEWLAHFSLGDLYVHDEYAAQVTTGPGARTRTSPSRNVP